MTNYFDKGSKRISATARLPIAVSRKLETKRDMIQEITELKISKNDLVTIGAILIAETNVNEEMLSNIESLSDLLSLYKKLNSKSE